MLGGEHADGTGLERPLVDTRRGVGSRADSLARTSTKEGPTSFCETGTGILYVSGLSTCAGRRAAVWHGMSTGQPCSTRTGSAAGLGPSGDSGGLCPAAERRYGNVAVWPATREQDQRQCTGPGAERYSNGALGAVRAAAAIRKAVDRQGPERTFQTCSDLTKSSF
jgi:hypothetical protein